MPDAAQIPPQIPSQIPTQGWPEGALKREAALIAAYAASRASFIALLDAIAQIK